MGELTTTSNGITIDTNGDVYVADVANHQRQKFDSKGKFIIQYESSSNIDWSQQMKHLDQVFQE